MRLRPSSIVAGLFLSIAAMGVAYIGGVMSGRDAARREREKPIVCIGENAIEAPAMIGEVSGEAEKAVEEKGILSPEELEFARVLRNERAAPKIDAEKDLAPAAGPADKKSEEQPENEPPLHDKGAGGEAREPAPENIGAIYDYVFQIGAFKDEAMADKLRETLEGQGFRTRMKRNGKLFIVLALLRGDEQRAADLVKAAEALRLGAPLELERKPVAPGKGRSGKK